MPIEGHLSELERKRRVLEEQIQAEVARPASDPPRLRDLKRKKLAIKEEIERIRREAASPPTN